MARQATDWGLLLAMTELCSLLDAVECQGLSISRAAMQEPSRALEDELAQLGGVFCLTSWLTTCTLPSDAWCWSIAFSVLQRHTLYSSNSSVWSSGKVTATDAYPCAVLACTGL